MCALLRKKFCSEKGQVLVFTVCMLPLLLGMMALVIELGNLYIHQSELQQVADSIALTGDGSKATTIINKNIQSSTFRVTPKFSPLSDANNFYIKLVGDVDPIFVKVFGETPFKLTAYAGASMNPTKKLIPLDKNVDYQWEQ